MELTNANVLSVPARARAGRDASLAEVAELKEALGKLSLAITERGLRTVQWSAGFVVARNHVEDAWRALDYAQQNLQEIRP